MEHPPTLAEVAALYEVLDQEARDELLQVLLIASAVSWEQVATVINELVLVTSVEADLREL